MRRILQVFYVIFSAIISALAIQNEILPFGSPFLGLFALVPLYLTLASAQSYAEAALLTGFQTGLVHVFSSFWLGNFKDFALFTLGASALATAVIGAVFGCYLYLPFAQSGRKKRNGYEAPTQPLPQRTAALTRRVLLFAAVWTVYEWAKSTGFLAYPWGTLVMTAYRWPLITQIAAITGTWGISFLFSLFAAVVAEGLVLLPLVPYFRRGGGGEEAAYARCGALCIVLFAVTVLYGAVAYTAERVPVKTMRTVMVQQNADSWETGGDAQAVVVSSELTEAAISEGLARTGTRPDLVVWSESVLSYAFPEAESYYRSRPAEMPLVPFIRQTGVPFVIGGPVTADYEKRQYHNSALYFDKDGNYRGYYAKMQLVPFAEVIPGAQYEWVHVLLDKIIGFSSGWTPGTELTLFTVPLPDSQTVKISLPICFEDAFPPVCRALYEAGSEVFVNITNDSWSKTDSAEYQHFVIASYRAIEYRTTLLRSTNSGYSVVVDPAGRILADMPLFETASIYTEVPVYERTQTPYALLGDWVPALCALAYAVNLVLGRTRRADNRKKRPEKCAIPLDQSDINC
ncbi:apolipoprotein N-acyltransferase [Treponema brennaborense]|uniref:Apolipoprotein N-acyltransferase n=1 Tax=Treponema brennaborense (strain DSM 12168 / CIP 105900 / DD5/3) TaxID=906968 RepID=F4LLG5_TREBD|nr:apolipoprotein N-acyltransferase [Treponema brennaborense]AEE16629.1 Apolipoprotein N-acyltransferase [Treponema brennaborense DSM 12168]